MKRRGAVWLLTVVLVSALLAGCESLSRKESASPSPSASPTATPTVTEALASAGDDLTRALTELRSRNVRGSLELVDRSIASLKVAAGGAGAVSRVAIEEALKKAESTREMIANGDKKAEEALAKVETAVTGLMNSVSGAVGEAKKSAATAIGAAADKVGAAADKVKEAVSAPSPTPSPKKKK